MLFYVPFMLEIFLLKRLRNIQVFTFILFLNISNIKKSGLSDQN